MKTFLDVFLLTTLVAAFKDRFPGIKVDWAAPDNINCTHAKAVDSRSGTSYLLSKEQLRLVLQNTANKHKCVPASNKNDLMCTVTFAAPGLDKVAFTYLEFPEFLRFKPVVISRRLRFIEAKAYWLEVRWQATEDECVTDSLQGDVSPCAPTWPIKSGRR